MARCSIVIADDDPQVRSFITIILKAQDFDVHEARDGGEAIEVLKGLAGAADLLITDIKMPGIDGVALARAAAEMYPTIPVLFISGWTFDMLDAPEWRKPGYAFLSKPFLPKALTAAVKELLGRRAMKAAVSLS